MTNLGDFPDRASVYPSLVVPFSPCDITGNMQRNTTHTNSPHTSLISIRYTGLSHIYTQHPALSHLHQALAHLHCTLGSRTYTSLSHIHMLHRVLSHLHSTSSSLTSTLNTELSHIYTGLSHIYTPHPAHSHLHQALPHLHATLSSHIYMLHRAPLTSTSTPASFRYTLYTGLSHIYTLHWLCPWTPSCGLTLAKESMFTVSTLSSGLEQTPCASQGRPY